MAGANDFMTPSANLPRAGRVEGAKSAVKPIACLPPLLAQHWMAS